jgi:uncharacterized membrane protein
VGDVFHFSDWCYNDPIWAPSIRKAWVTRLPGPDGTGMVSHYVGKVVGREMEWDGESIRWRRNESWARRASSGLPGKMNLVMEMRFEPLGPRQTRVTAQIQYRVPYPLFGWLLDRFYVRREIQQMARNAVQGLKKTSVEGGIKPVEAQMEKRKQDHAGYRAI